MVGFRMAALESWRAWSGERGGQGLERGWAGPPSLLLPAKARFPGSNSRAKCCRPWAAGGPVANCKLLRQLLC